MQSLKFKILHRLHTRTHANGRRARFSLNIRIHTGTCVRMFANNAHLYVCMYIHLYVFCFAFGAALSPFVSRFPHSPLPLPNSRSLSLLPSRRRRAVVFQTYCAARIFSTMWVALSLSSRRSSASFCREREREKERGTWFLPEHWQNALWQQ